ncbi:MAG: hydrogenase iron-sulfur subunit [Promethearchaeota archaeon]
MNFEPKILGFLCNWCSYAGADLAGVSRIQYPPNIRIIRVMCSGRVDPEFFFEGFLKGIDGIILTGCHLGDCHYLEGNYEALMKFDLVKRLLSFINFGNRVRLEWVSASEGKRFAEVVTDFTNHIKEIGPSPIGLDNPDPMLVEKLKALKNAAGSQKLRALVGRERKITEQENVYGEVVSKEKFIELLDKAIKDEFERQWILLKLQKEPKSVKDIAKELEIDSSEVLNHIVSLRGQNLVVLEKIEGLSPIYAKIGEN